LKREQKTSSLPVIMLTARGHHLSPEQLAMTNIRMLLPKPFSARELLEHVDELMSRGGSRTMDRAGRRRSLSDEPGADAA
jgi:DNA-binding response OmpR family regulator